MILDLIQQHESQFCLTKKQQDLRENYKGCYSFLPTSRDPTDYWGDQGVDGWIILGWITRRWDVGIWTGLGWPRIETGGGRL